MEKIATKNRRTSKFIREYGMTLIQIDNKYNINKSYVWILHQRGDLHKFIEEQEKEKAEAPSR